ncbi:hypothetical protein ACFXTO_019740 [Malus domestica]
MYIEELTIEEVVTQVQQFLKFMEVSGPSKLVIEKISSSERDVGPTTVKPIRSRGLITIEGPEVDDCCTSQLVQTCVTEVRKINVYFGNGQKERNCEGPEENKGKSVGEVGEEDTQVEEGDTEVGDGDVAKGMLNYSLMYLLVLKGMLKKRMKKLLKK